MTRRLRRRPLAMPTVPSMTDGRTPAKEAPAKLQPAVPLDRTRVQHLDPVRAIYRPTNTDKLSPRLKRLIGREDLFRRVGEADPEAMMQCPPHWPVRLVPIGDLEILEILEDQDIRAG